MAVSQAPDPAHPPNPEIEIDVNRKAFKIEGPTATGLQIKEAAIAAGVQIELSFQLSEKLPHRETKIIGDSDPVELQNGLHFIAVAGDDNS
jgi:hypothetical protein